VSISISGQNERWAQLNAYQPPAAQSGQAGGTLPAAGTTTSPGSIGNSNSIPGATSGALSDGMSFALMAFSSSWGTAAATSSQGASPGSGTADGLSPSAPAAGSSPQSQLLTDVQSLLSALMGGSGSSASGASGSNATATAANSGTGTQTSLSSSLLQDLQTVASDLGTIDATSGSSRPGGSPQSASPRGDDNANTSDTGTSAPGGNAGAPRPGYSDGFQQQYAVSAYSAGMMSGPDNAAMSALGSISV
jgi:hypothetical protein